MKDVTENIVQRKKKAYIFFLATVLTNNAVEKKKSDLILMWQFEKLISYKRFRCDLCNECRNAVSNSAFSTLRHRSRTICLKELSSSQL